MVYKCFEIENYFSISLLMSVIQMKGKWNHRSGAEEHIDERLANLRCYWNWFLTTKFRVQISTANFFVQGHLSYCGIGKVTVKSFKKINSISYVCMCVRIDGCLMKMFINITRYIFKTFSNSKHVEKPIFEI